MSKHTKTAQKFRQYVSSLTRECNKLERRRNRLAEDETKSAEQVKIEKQLDALNKICIQIDDIVAKKLPILETYSYGPRKVGSRNVPSWS